MMIVPGNVLIGTVIVEMLEEERREEEVMVGVMKRKRFF
jgi:hypothetical protein